MSVKQSEVSIDPSIVLPGDELTSKTAQNTSSDKSKIILGPGLRREDKDRIVAIKCGQLVNRNNSVFWIDSYQKRYIASKADRVIGYVVSKAALSVRLDIGTNETASLSLLAFPNTTKRNKAMLEVGDAVYAQIVTAHKDMESELVCMNASGKKDGLGKLSNNGLIVSVATNIVRRLLAPDSQLLETLGKKYKYEIAIGMNGRVWINSNNVETTITISNIISQLDAIPKAQYQQLCQQILQGFQQIKHKK